MTRAMASDRCCKGGGTECDVLGGKGVDLGGASCSHAPPVMQQSPED